MGLHGFRALGRGSRHRVAINHGEFELKSEHAKQENRTIAVLARQNRLNLIMGS